MIEERETYEVSKLETLATKLADAKAEENAAKAKRIEAEEAIAALVDTGENQSKTVAAGIYKVTVKRELGYKADVDAIRSLDIAEEVMPVKLVPAKHVFDPKEYERVIDEHPNVAGQLAEFVTVTPRKVQVSLKVG